MRPAEIGFAKVWEQDCRLQLEALLSDDYPLNWQQQGINGMAVYR